MTVFRPGMDMNERAMNADSVGPMTDRSSLLARGRPIGRSASLNYKPGNPAKSMAGQVPWVRLKRRESVALSDIVRGRAPHSPNTIKIASPEPSHLLPAPSFKVTPLIVTTEANRNRVIDTQTVVSALREKRKRIGGSQPEENICDDTSWQNAAKRRRQDSSQSNASSVSIPPMPETLPNLIGSPDTSMLHIENVSGQRPSTVPSIDAYVNRHIQDVGLGGEQIPSMQPLQLPKQYPPQASANKNSNKLTQRALQSSLSSSLRARNNLSLLERGGIDFSRIRSNSIGSVSKRRTSFSSDISMLDKSVDNPLASRRCPTSQDMSEPTTSVESKSSSSDSTAKSSPNSSQNLSTVSAPTKRKIAEGVMLRKQNLSINSSNSPLRASKPPQSGIPVGTLDLEQDRSKEYQRRVLDLLTDNDATPKTTSVETFGKSLPPLATSSSVPLTSSSQTTSLGTSTSLAASSAATSAAVSASLDSLNKLVQSTTENASNQAGGKPAPSTTMLSSVPSLPVSGVPSIGSSSLSPVSSTEALSSKSIPAVTSSLLSSILSMPNHTPTLTSTPAVSTSVTTASFSLGQSAAPSLSSASGFQVNFGNVIASAGTGSAASTALSASTSTTPLSPQFSFGLVSSASSPPGAPAQGLSTPLVSNATSSQISGGISFGTSVPSGISPNFGSMSSSSSTIATSILSPSQSKPAVPGFSFGIQPASSTQPALASGLFNFGSTTSKPGSTVSSAAPAQALGTGITAFGPVSSAAANQTLGNPGASAPSLAGGFNFKLPNTSTSDRSGGLGISSAGMHLFSAQPTSTTPSTASSLTMPPATSASLSQPIGIFGGSVSTASVASPPGGIGVQPFNFGSNPSQSGTTPTVQSPPALGSSLGAPSSQQNPIGGFSFGQATSSSPSASLFQFGGTPVSSEPSASVAAFGPTVTPSSTSAGPIFGGSQGLTANPQAVFSSPSTQSVPPVAFGGTAPNFGAGSMSFGGATTTVTAPVFGASSNSGFNPAGSSVSQQPSAFGQSTSAGGTPFNFGAQPNTSQPQTFGTSLSTAFGTTPTASTNAPSIFGGNPSVSNAPAFGSATSSSVSVFGGQNTLANATNPQSVFGSSAAAPAFGSGQATKPPSFGSAPTQAGVFGSVPATQPSVFGPGSTASQPTIFGSGITSQPQAFGSAPSTQASVFGAGQATQPSVFGSGQVSQPSVFGSPATTQPSIFGSGQATQNAPFGSGPTTQASSFGTGSTNVFGATSPSAPAFGAPNQPSAPAFGAMNQNEAKPAFGAVSTTGVSMFGAPKTNPFNVAAPSAGSAFTFNAGQGSQTMGVANPFNATATSTGTAGFNFKPPSEQPANASGGFNFTPQMPQSTFQAPISKPAPATGFNFSASTPAAPNFNFSATPNANNMFTPQPTGTVHRPRAAGRRPVRRGARR